MNNALVAIGSLFALLAAAIHVYIFILESFLWRHPSTWRIFGIRSQADADTTAFLAYNQGFYNLFLAVGAVIGILLQDENRLAACAVTIFACASMAMAAVVLVTASRRSLRPALIQGTFPLLAVVFTTIGMMTD